MPGAAIRGPDPAVARPAGVFSAQGRDSTGVFSQSRETGREVLLKDSWPEVRLILYVQV